MKDYAISMTASRGYMPGINAALNALEFHGFDVDVYVWLDSAFLPRSYTEQFPNVHFDLIDFAFQDFVPSHGWAYRFFNVHVMTQMLRAGTHRVVLLWDADALILTNYMKLYMIADKAEQIIMSYNEMTCSTMEELPTEWPYPKRTRGKYSSVPLFVPAVHADYLELMADYQRRGVNFGIWCGNNYAARDYGEEHIFALPGEQWVQSSHRWKMRQVFPGCLQMSDHSSTPMYSAHKKFWGLSAVKRKSQHPIPAHNIRLYNQLYNFFGLKCRVKWLEGLESLEG